MTNELSSRVGVLENDVADMKNALLHEIVSVRNDFEAITEKHLTVLENVGKQIETAINYHKESLPIGLVMRLFTFFSLLNIGMFSAVLGIKWIDTKFFEGHTFVQEQRRDS